MTLGTIQDNPSRAKLYKHSRTHPSPSTSGTRPVCAAADEMSYANSWLCVSLETRVLKGPRTGGIAEKAALLFDARGVDIAIHGGITIFHSIACVIFYVRAADRTDIALS